jgi:hypothetical protein
VELKMQLKRCESTEKELAKRSYESQRLIDKYESKIRELKLKMA